MKKNIILTLIFCALFSVTFAQGLYVGVNAGYAMRSASWFNTTDVDINNSEVKPMSLGLGFDAGLNLGYMFNKNVGIELGASYLIGGKNKFKYTYSDGTEEVFYKASMIRIIPAVVIAAGFETIDPYAKFGALIGFGSFKYESEGTYDDAFRSTMATEEVYKVKYKGGVAFGFYAALGANYNLSEKLALFAELNLESMSYAPTKGEITEYTIDGVDQLGSMDVKDKEWEFVKEINYDENIPDTSPDKELKEKYPFSSIGLNLGVKIRL